MIGQIGISPMIQQPAGDTDICCRAKGYDLLLPTQVRPSFWFRGIRRHLHLNVVPILGRDLLQRSISMEVNSVDIRAIGQK